MVDALFMGYKRHCPNFQYTNDPLCFSKIQYSFLFMHLLFLNNLINSLDVANMNYTLSKYIAFHGVKVNHFHFLITLPEP